MENIGRPAVWVGHVALRTADPVRSGDFMLALGMRGIFKGDDVWVLELRGGTHLILLRDAEATPGDADFDLMVEDLEAAHQSFRDRGYTATDIERGRIHDSFQITEPGGNRITFNSTHVEDHGLV